MYEALSANGKDKEAQECLNKALEIIGNTAYDKMQKGRINFLLGENKTALELLEEEGIEFVAVEPPRELKKDKKVTLDAFG